MNDENKFEELFKKYDEKMEQRIIALVAESEKNTQRHTGALSEDFHGKL